MILPYQWTWGLDTAGDAMRIRTQVFVVEQRVPAEIELDDWDSQAWHLVAYDAHNPVGTLRLFVDETGQWCVGRMAIQKDYRGLGYGRLLLSQALVRAKELVVPSLLLHAQVQAQGFYQKLGFMGFGEVFEEAGIPHQLMRLDF